MFLLTPLSNMETLLRVGRVLEPKLGSARFAILSSLLIVLTGVVHIGLSFVPYLLGL